MLPLERAAAVDPTELYSAVSSALWLHRERLETLLYRLATEHFVLTSGRTRWLAKADDDVRAALDELRHGELERAMAVDAITQRLALATEPTLAELAAGAPGVWTEILSEHRSALRELSFEVQRAVEENQRLLQSGVNAVRETLAGIGNVVRRYDATGAAVHSVPAAMMLDQQA